MISWIPLRQHDVLPTSQAMEDGIQNTLAKAIGIDLPRLTKLLKTANLVSNSAHEEGKLFINNQQWKQLISTYNAKRLLLKLEFKSYRLPKCHGIEGEMERPEVILLVASNQP